MNQLLKYTDFILVSDTGKEFPCNKTVLALQSKVFERNFEMKESKEVQEGQMKIPDISDKTLEILVTFMYTQKINDEDVSIDLLVLADQYDIETLRKIGKKLPVLMFLIKIDISIEFSNEILFFAPKYIAIIGSSNSIAIKHLCNYFAFFPYRCSQNH